MQETAHSPSINNKDHSAKYVSDLPLLWKAFSKNSRDSFEFHAS